MNRPNWTPMLLLTILALLAAVAVMAVALNTQKPTYKPIPLQSFQHELASRGYPPDHRFDSLQEGPEFNIRCWGYSNQPDSPLLTDARMVGFQVVSWCRTVAK